jgi:hypothetical protein
MMEKGRNKDKTQEKVRPNPNGGKSEEVKDFQRTLDRMFGKEKGDGSNLAR